MAGWPQIWQNPRIPPKIQEAQAAQATIDATVNTTKTSHNGSSPTTVFISENTGYAFYCDSGGNCVYSKTTDGGVNWGTAVTVGPNTVCLKVAVWYDRWTPGDTTGNLIHIATIDSTNDDIFYRYLDTSSDTLSTGPVNITSGLGYAGSLTAANNLVTIAKGTDGALYAAVSDDEDNMAVRCTATCITAGNWSVSEPASWSVGKDFQILVPRLSGEMMFIWWDISASTKDIKYSRYTGSWSAWANIDTARDNTTYDGSFGAVVDPSNGDIYLAYAAQAATLGTNDDIRVKKFSGSSWSSLTDVVTDSVCAGVANCGITGVKIARDNDTGYLYVLYSARSTPGTAASANVYWKYSTDSGTTWSSEFGPVYSTDDDIYGARLSLMPTANERIYATWYAATPDDLFGRPIAPKTFQQSAYRFFENNDSTDVGTALAVQDTAATLGSSGAAFRLRLLLHTGVSDLFTNEGSFKLQFAQRGTDNQCDTSFSGETYADVTAATAIAYKDNPTPADGAALTANANDPTHGADTIVNQTYEELNNFTNSQAAILAGQDGKWDFALYDNGAPASTTYCFRAVKSDGTVLTTYTVIPQITTSVSVPVVSNVKLNNQNNIDLVENSTTTISATADLYDSQGCSDITSVTAKIYRSGVTNGKDCTPNENNCYSVASCSITNCSGNYASTTCSIDMWFNADPTDSDTPWASEYWRAYIEATDSGSLTGYNYSPADVPDVNSLLALSVDGSINYGSLNPLGKTDPLTATTTVSATGNISLDVNLMGTNLCTDYPTCASYYIPVGKQVYATSSVSYSSGTPLAADPGGELELNCPKTISHTSLQTKDVYWGIEIPKPQKAGSYTGEITFTAVKNELPWP